MLVAKGFKKTVYSTIILSLMILSIFLTPNIQLWAQPPSEGTWNISGHETIENTNLIINGSISIATSGSLRIINSTVTFNVTEKGESINLYGALSIENSIITVLNTSNSLSIKNAVGSSLTIVNSKIYYTQIIYRLIQSTRTTNITIANSEIHYSYLKIKQAALTITNTTFENIDRMDIYNTENATISKNTFANSTDIMFLNYGTNIELSENTFSNITGTAIELDVGTNIAIKQNTFNNVKTAISANSQKSLRVENNYFANVDDAVDIEKSTATFDSNNYNYINNIAVYMPEGGFTLAVRFNNETVLNANKGFVFFDTKISITGSTFENVTTDAVAFYDLQLSVVRNCTFNNIDGAAIKTENSQSVTVSDNFINNTVEGISIDGGRDNEVSTNRITYSKNGIVIKYTKSFIVTGNILEHVVSGFYIEQSIRGALTSNGLINGRIGFSLWSTRHITLSSNGAFDAEIGIAVYFGDRNKIKGNDINNTNIGLLVVNGPVNYLLDNYLQFVNTGIKVLNSKNITVSGNTFTQISDTAIIFDNSNYFLVYYNNFMSVANDNYAEVTNCIGYFNSSKGGNYYPNHVGDTEVHITDVTINGDIIALYDYAPLNYSHVVKPSIEYVERNITKPTDQDPVGIECQIFATNVKVTVGIQYLLLNETTWRTINITDSGKAVSEVGNIKVYSGVIPPLPYTMKVLYRIMLSYEDQGKQVYIYSENDTYEVISSDKTPVIIGEPEVYQRYTYIDTEGKTITTTTKAEAFYQHKQYIIYVEVKNQTVDIAIENGQRQVYINYTVYDPVEKSNQTSQGVFNYNSTAKVYYYELETWYYSGMIITYKIGVKDVNGNEYWTFENYTIEFLSQETAHGGYDAATLLTVGGLLFVIQTVVVLRRRKNEKT